MAEKQYEKFYNTIRLREAGCVDLGILQKTANDSRTKRLSIV